MFNIIGESSHSLQFCVFALHVLLSECIQKFADYDY